MVDSVTGQWMTLGLFDKKKEEQGARQVQQFDVLSEMLETGRLGLELYGLSKKESLFK